MPPPSQTRRHSRHSSAADSLMGSPHRRRQSKSSFQDPATPTRNSFNRQDSMDMSMFSSGGPGSGADGTGMGNLADELADAFSDSGDDEDGSLDVDATDSQGHIGHDHAQDSGQVQDELRSGKNGNCLGVPTAQRKGHQRKGSQYDGSEFGSDTDLHADGLPPSLVAKIDDVESLTRRGTENYGGPEDDVVKRVADSLRSLGSQSSVEASASRLITAHSALTTHLSHQTRQVHSLTFPLLSPLVMPPDAETIENLVPLLVSLSETMPRPLTSAFNSLTALHSITSELIMTLNYLSDNLHMLRQTTTTATRRLKSAKELVAEMRRDEELKQQGERWLDQENWGERLSKRECAGVCREVIGGFEEVCNDWRERLLAQAEAQA